MLFRSGPHRETNEARGAAALPPWSEAGCHAHGPIGSYQWVEDVGDELDDGWMFWIVPWEVDVKLENGACVVS